MRDINLGPVWNPDGTPTDLTKEMLAGTGRLEDGSFKRPEPLDIVDDREESLDELSERHSADGDDPMDPPAY